MELKYFDYMERRATVGDPKTGENFTLGVYLDDDQKYKISSPFNFQKPVNGIGGSLRNHTYFIVNGREIENGRKRLEDAVNELNRQDQGENKDPISYLKNTISGLDIYKSHEESIIGMASEALGKTKVSLGIL
ncbi:hypothetical protein HYW75_02835 [Candidatus Pacearchaeota archaeon]|nr:hypothetical protein [Candidatus Pacearchaeota archaeon]